MRQGQTRYDAQFRADAVALVRQSDKSLRKIAGDLGVAPESLRRWAQQQRTDAGQGTPGALATDEREELRRLRRENKTLLLEREILKKAAAFVASEAL